MATPATVSKMSTLQRFTHDALVEDLAHFIWPGLGPAYIVPVVPNGDVVATSLVGKGIRSRDGRRLTLEDGEAFLDALPFVVSHHSWSQWLCLGW